MSSSPMSSTGEPSDAGLRALRIESSGDERVDRSALMKKERVARAGKPVPATPRDDALSSSSSQSSSEADGDTRASKLAVPDRLKFELDFEAEAESLGEKKGDEDDTAAIFREFEDWLLSNGAQFPALYLKRYGDSEVRGVHASRAVPAFQCVIEIPLQCLITDEMGRHTAMGRELFSQSYNLSTPNLIAVLLYMMETREDPEHFFQPYYRVLPRSYESFPIFYSPEQLSWLEGSPLIADIEDRKRNMRADYDEICRLVPRFRSFSFDDFLRVRTAVGSRNFGIVVHGQKRTAMVPYSDMLNHYRPRETSWTFEDAKDAFTITSLAPLAAGQQVMDSYGKKCNSKFLLHYGFAVMDNREEDGKCQNEIMLRLSMPGSGSSDDEGDETEDDSKHEHEQQQQDVSQRDAELLELRLAALGSSRAARGFRLSMNIEDKATAEALAFCRVAVATEAELAELLDGDGAEDDDDEDDDGEDFLGDDGLTAARSNGSSRSGARARLRPAKPPRRAREPALRDPAGSYVGPRNEAAALHFLASACARQLQRYPQSYEDNLRLLRSGELKPFSVRLTTLVVVTGEQEILHFWLRAAETVGAQLIMGGDGDDETPLYQKLRSLPRETAAEADLARYAARVAYEMRMRAPRDTAARARAAQAAADAVASASN